MAFLVRIESESEYRERIHRKRATACFVASCCQHHGDIAPSLQHNRPIYWLSLGALMSYFFFLSTGNLEHSRTTCNVVRGT